MLLLPRFQKAPAAFFHQTAKKILKYCHGTTTHGLLYESGNININGFVDSDIAGNIQDKNLMPELTTISVSASRIWGSEKQPTVALSTWEAVYHALRMVAKELIWMRRVIQELGFQIINLTTINIDNQSGFDWARSDKSPSTRAKHIDVQVHFTRSLYQKVIFDIPYVRSEDNDAEIFPKPLDKIKHTTICKRTGLVESFQEEC